eukprot:COSAG02_NODE_4696_length_5085_cov_2.504813_7_plen_330_part_00
MVGQTDSRLYVQAVRTMPTPLADRSTRVDEWSAKLEAWDARCEAADVAQAAATDAAAAVEALDLRLAGARTSSSSAMDQDSESTPSSKRARLGSRCSGCMVAELPCELEEHDLCVGRLRVKLQRRVRGIAPSAIASTTSSADEFDQSMDTTGLDLWTPAVRLFVSFLQSDRGQQLVLPASNIPLRVLELGAGLGAAGLFAAQCMGSQVISLCLTDGAECVLPLLQQNASLNLLHDGTCAVAERLRFGNDGDGRKALATAMGRLSASDQSPPRLLVIGCEVLFCRSQAAALLRTLRHLLCHPGHEGGSIALFSHTVRRTIFAGPDGQLMR